MGRILKALRERLRKWAETPPPVSGANVATILVADDEPYIVRYAEVNLQRAGYRVITTTAADNVLPLAQLEHPALIVLDSHMPHPRPTGCEILRALRADPKLGQTPVVLMASGVARHIDGECCRDRLTEAEHGALTGYLLKPFNPMDLLKLVRQRIALDPYHGVDPYFRGSGRLH
jgi:two-component system, chemotaxis family, chemotaxis protein CheY